MYEREKKKIKEGNKLQLPHFSFFIIFLKQHTCSYNNNGRRKKYINMKHKHNLI